MKRKNEPAPAGTLMSATTRSLVPLWCLFAVAGLSAVSIMVTFSPADGREGGRILALILDVVLLPLLVAGFFEWLANPQLFLLESGIILRRRGADTTLSFSDVSRIQWTRSITGLSVTISFRNHREFGMKGEGQNGQLARRLSAMSGVAMEGL